MRSLAMHTGADDFKRHANDKLRDVQPDIIRRFAKLAKRR